MSQQELHSNAKMKNKDIKKEKRFIETFLSLSRGDRIRTCDHLVPNQARYRTALHPVLKLRVQRYNYFFTYAKFQASFLHSLPTTINLFILARYLLFSFYSYK